MFNGNMWIVLGAPTRGGLLYDGEFDAMEKDPANGGRFTTTYAISREMKNKVDGGRMYVQHVIMERGEEIFNRLEKGAIMYFCGLKGMMDGVGEAMETVCKKRGKDWKEVLKGLKANKQWHVEVY